MSGVWGAAPKGFQGRSQRDYRVQGGGGGDDIMNSFVGFAGCTPKCGQHPRGLQGFQRGKGFPFVGSPSFQLPTFQHSRIWGPQQIVGLSFFGTSPPPISRPQSLPSPLPYFGVPPGFWGPTHLFGDTTSKQKRRSNSGQGFTVQSLRSGTTTVGGSWEQSPELRPQNHPKQPQKWGPKTLTRSASI